MFLEEGFGESQPHSGFPCPVRSDPDRLRVSAAPQGGWAGNLKLQATGDSRSGHHQFLKEELVMLDLCAISRELSYGRSDL